MTVCLERHNISPLSPFSSTFATINVLAALWFSFVFIYGNILTALSSSSFSRMQCFSFLFVWEIDEQRWSARINGCIFFQIRWKWRAKWKNPDQNEILMGLFWYFICFMALSSTMVALSVRPRWGDKCHVQFDLMMFDTHTHAHRSHCLCGSRICSARFRRNDDKLFRVFLAHNCVCCDSAFVNIFSTIFYDFKDSILRLSPEIDRNRIRIPNINWIKKKIK